MYLNKYFNNLSETEKIEQLKSWIAGLKDDDINKIILKNRLDNLNNLNSKKIIKNTKFTGFEVNNLDN